MQVLKVSTYENHLSSALSFYLSSFYNNNLMHVLLCDQYVKPLIMADILVFKGSFVHQNNSHAFLNFTMQIKLRGSK